MAIPKQVVDGVLACYEVCVSLGENDYENNLAILLSGAALGVMEEYKAESDG